VTKLHSQICVEMIPLEHLRATFIPSETKTDYVLELEYSYGFMIHLISVLYNSWR